MIGWKLIPALFFDEVNNETSCQNCDYLSHHIIRRPTMDQDLPRIFNGIDTSIAEASEDVAIKIDGPWDHFKHIACCLLFLITEHPVKTQSIISQWLELYEKY